MEDVGEAVGPLLRLAATALARNPPTELKSSRSSPNSSFSDHEESSRGLDGPQMELSGPALPVPCSQALFDSHREAADETDEPLEPHSLNPFLDGVRFPLETLNLEGCVGLSDHKLSRLLRAQKHSLRSLNISGCERLSHRLSGQLRKLRMTQLANLTIGFSNNVLGSWFEDPEPLTAASIFAGVESLMSNGGNCRNCGLPATPALQQEEQEQQPESSTSNSNPTTSARDPLAAQAALHDSDVPGPSTSSTFDDSGEGSSASRPGLDDAWAEEPTWTDLTYASSSLAAPEEDEPILPMDDLADIADLADSAMEEEAEEADEDELEEEEELEPSSQADIDQFHRMLNQLQSRGRRPSSLLVLSLAPASRF